MNKKNSPARDFKKATQQRGKQRSAQLSAEMVDSEGGQEHLERHGSYRGPDIKKYEKPRHDRVRGSRDGHLSVKGVVNGEAIAHLSGVVGEGPARRLIDPKRASRTSRQQQQPS